MLFKYKLVLCNIVRMLLDIEVNNEAQQEPTTLSGAVSSVNIISIEMSVLLWRGKTTSSESKATVDICQLYICIAS